MKNVVYNGTGTKNWEWEGYTNPAVLKEGHKYEVISRRREGNNVDYKLRGIDGTFNSKWFNEVKPRRRTLTVVSQDIPEEGKRLKCIRPLNVRGELRNVEYKTGKIIHVEIIGENGENVVYEAITEDTMYIVYVLHALEHDKCVN